MRQVLRVRLLRLHLYLWKAVVEDAKLEAAQGEAVVVDTSRCCGEVEVGRAGVGEELDRI